ncbi:MAG: hypothetical protein IPJ27_07205 [Candidatus Accumulibacter sp.]|uniref:Uncharacterized protein n=1 Tax=Candidatus Accumulibacter proximus TaxID=2954385 RepID=A0A935PWD5_9PROT|nr:hypothetical protein [Candidatus Accumulibacter proximus]
MMTADSAQGTKIIESPSVDYARMTARYQKLHLIITGTAAALSLITVITIIVQVYNLAKQTENQTKVLDVQSRSLDSLNQSLQAQERALSNHNWQFLINQDAEISRVLMEHPELRPYFYASKPINDKDKNFDRVILLADMYLDFVELFDKENIKRIIGSEDRQKYLGLWNNYFRDIFQSSPVLCSHYYEVKDWYMASVGEYAAKYCSKRP